MVQTKANKSNRGQAKSTKQARFRKYKVKVHAKYKHKGQREYTD